MTPELAGLLLSHLDRAWQGAELCRDRLRAEGEGAVRIDLGAGVSMLDRRGLMSHDVDYYAWEAVRVVRIADKVIAAGLRGCDDVALLRAELLRESPKLIEFRNAITHPEDNRGADDVWFFGDAVRLLSGGEVEYLVDPEDELGHDALGALVTVCEAALRRAALTS